jgi:hypothetical protein
MLAQLESILPHCTPLCVAVCGTIGSGKSSLIQAFLKLCDDPSAPASAASGASGATAATSAAKPAAPAAPSDVKTAAVVTSASSAVPALASASAGASASSVSQPPSSQPTSKSTSKSKGKAQVPVARGADGACATHPDYDLRRVYLPAAGSLEASSAEQKKQKPGAASSRRSNEDACGLMEVSSHPTRTRGVALSLAIADATVLVAAAPMCCWCVCMCVREAIEAISVVCGLRVNSWCRPWATRFRTRF